MLVDRIGWHLELDERHVRSVLDRSGMGWAKAVVTAGSKEASTAATAAGEIFRTRTATETASRELEMSYDTSFATKEVMRDGSNPTVESLQQVKRVARSLKRNAKTSAGRPKTRCSTSGRGTAKLKNTQRDNVARHTQQYHRVQPRLKKSQSRSDARNVCTPRMRMKGLTCETHNLELWTDGSRARAISKRVGLGRRAKHPEVHTNRRDEHEADVLTNHVQRAVLDKLRYSVGYCFLGEEEVEAQDYQILRDGHWKSMRE